MRRAALAVIIALSLSTTTIARADRVADADALFKAAKELTQAEQWTEACEKFEASFELDEQLGTLLNIADCYEHVNRFATAWERWNRAQSWAKRDDDERSGYIEERRSAIEDRVPWLIIDAQEDSDLIVKRGDYAVPSASYGVRLPVDMGTIVIGVYRGETLLEERRVTPKEGETSTLTLDLAAIAKAHPPPPDPVPPTPLPVVPPPPPPPPPSPKEPYDPTQRNAGIIVAAVGGAAVLTAVALEIAAVVKKNQADADDACVNGFCSPSGLEDARDGATFAEAGQWLGIAGLGVAAIGITVWLTAPSEDDVALRLGPGGLSLEGRF